MESGEYCNVTPQTMVVLGDLCPELLIKDLMMNLLWLIKTVEDI